MQKITGNISFKKFIAYLLVVGLLLTYQPSGIFVFADEATGTKITEEVTETKTTEETAKIKTTEEAADTKKGEEAAEPKTIEEAAETKKAEETADTKKADEAADTKKAEEAADTKKAEEAADTKKAEETADTKKAEETADTKKAEETADTKKAEETADTKKAEETADTKKAEETADTKKADEAVDTKKADEAADTKKADEAADTKTEDEVVETKTTSYAVTFDLKGVVATDIENQTVEEGKKVSRPENPSNDDNCFIDWFTSKDEGATLSDKAYDFGSEVNEAITLYAKWVSKSSDEYTDAKLANLEVARDYYGEYKLGYLVPSFNSNVMEYRACQRGKIFINPTLSSKFATLEVDGEKADDGDYVKIEFGSNTVKEVEIKVTALNGDTEIYKVAVTKLPSSTDNIVLKEDFNTMLDPQNGIKNYIALEGEDDLYQIESLTTDDFELKSVKDEGNVSTIAKSDIAFITSAIKGKKINDDTIGSESMKKMDTANCYTDWKITKYNNCTDFKANVEGGFAVISANENFEFNYENAKVGENCYISALLVKTDTRRKEIYYGRLKTVKEEAEKNGPVSIKLPKNFSGGEFILYIFSEEYNGDWKSDNVSNMIEIPLKINALSSSTGLLPMKIPGCPLEPEYKGSSSDKVSYGEVPFDTETITFTLTGEDTNTTIKVNEESIPNGEPHTYVLKPGYNQFDIESRSETEKSYAHSHIGIRRLANEEETAAICLDNSPLKVYSDSGYRKILFGNWDDKVKNGRNPKPVKWRILDTTSNDGNKKALFLLRDELLNDDPEEYGIPYGKTNDWKTSSIRKWLNEGYLSKAFTSEEKAVVLETNKIETEKVTGKDGDDRDIFFLPSNLKNDKLFLLSALEIKTSKYGFSEDVAKKDYIRSGGNSYYLRSGLINYFKPSRDEEEVFGKNSNSSVVVGSYGNLSTWMLNWTMARPAMNIDSSKIAFTSAVGAKDDAEGMFIEVPKLKGNREWVLTLKSDIQDFAVTEETLVGGPGNNLEFHYENAKTGDNQYISALILDDKDEVKYYSRLFKVNEANGTGTFAVPLIGENTYKVKIFNEQYYGTGRTSVASNFDELSLEVQKLNGLLVQFMTNGGTPIPQGIITKGGHTILEPNEKPKKTGFSFMGWYADKEFTKLWNFEKNKVWENTVIYARWEAVDLQANAPGTYEVPVTLEKLGVSKACMVIVEDGNPEHTVTAPYNDGKITVRVPAAGDYSFTAGKSIEEIMQSGKLDDKRVTYNSYMGTGEIGDPYHTIVNLLNQKENRFGLMWYIPTTWAGYFTKGDGESSDKYNASLVKSVVFEARDFDTGKVLGTLTMDGSRRHRVPIGKKFPFPMSLWLEPSKSDLENWVGKNELYNYEGSIGNFGESKARANKLIAEAEKALDSDDEILIVHESRRENFGPYTMKLEVKDSFNFDAKQHVKVVYLGGTGGGDYQGGTDDAPSIEKRLEDEFTKYKYYEKNIVVDKDGYVTFDLYNSGLFKLVKTNEKATPEYTVTFNSNGGSMVMAERVEQDSLVEKPEEDPAKPGYKFAGWFADEKLTKTWDFGKDKVTGNKTLYAKWQETASSFVVHFDFDGMDDQTIANGGKISKPVNPTKVNKIFAGWYSDAEHTKLWDFNINVVTEELNLYPDFMDVTYKDLKVGQNELNVNLNGQSGACLVMITNGNDSINAITVANEGKINEGKVNVDIATAGDYAVKIIDTVEHLTLDGKSEPLENAYKGDGTETNPYVILANIANIPTKSDFGLKWAVPANWAGYSGGGANNKTSETYDVSLTKNVVFETRDYKTGRLIASGNINGKVAPDKSNARKRIPVLEKCPFNMNFRINPTSDQVDYWLEHNKLYSYTEKIQGYKTGAERAEILKQKALNILDDKEQALLMFDNGREFFGPVNFRIDVQRYGFKSEDKIYIKYLGGTGGGEYHGKKVKLEQVLADEFTWSGNNTKSATVDKDGYIDISLYNGGMYKLSKTKENTCEVVFKCNGGSVVAKKTISIGSKVQKPTDPTKKDSTFKGWFSDSELTTAFDFEKIINEDTIIYAKWTSNGGTGGTGGESGGEIVGKTYKVEFVTGKTATGKNTATLPVQKVEEGKRATDPDKDSKTCPFGFYDRGDGYLVLDWYTDPNLKNKFRFSNPITKDTKLYPKYQRYILKDDGRADSGSGSKSNPKCVKLGDTKQSKIAWKYFNYLASGKLSGYYKVYVEKKNDGDELFSWTFNSNDFKKCDIAQPYYIYINTNKVGNTLELKMANRTAIEGKVTISVDVSKYIKKDCEVDVEYKSGSCDGMVAHSNFEGDWAQTHHLPKSYFTKKKADVEDGYVTFDINHGGTYIIKSDQIKADDSGATSTTAGTGKVIEKEKVKAGEKINTTKMNQIVKDKKLLLVESKEGNILFDLKAVQTLKKEIMGTLKVDIDLIKNVKLTEKQKEKAAKKIENRPVYELEVKTGNKSISTFGGGKVTVTLPYTLKATEKSSGLVMWHLKDDGELVDIPCTYDAKKKEITFKTTHFSYYVVGYDKNLEWDSPFSDVKESDWFYRAIAYVNKNNLMSGVSKDKFMPNGKTTRAMLVTVLYRNEGSPKVENKVAFKDVKESKWYTDAVCWAVKNDIITGYNELTFGTNDPITREQLVSILYRYGKMKKMDMNKKGQIDGFKDSNLVSSWASDGIKWAVGAEVLNGKGNNNLDPKGKATRAEVATVIQKVLKIEGNQ